MKMSIKTKMILFILATITIIFLLIGIYHTIYRMQELKNRIGKDADLFVQLVNEEIGKAFELYFDNTFFKFRSIVLEHSRRNRDLTNIQIINLDGRVLYDMNKMETASFPTVKVDVTADSFIVNNLKRIKSTTKVDKEIKIISPYFDDYGIQKLSIVYYFSFAQLQKEVKNIIGPNIFVALLIFIASLAGAIFVSGRITNHLKILLESAKKYAYGNFEEQIMINTNDEFEDLAKAFNAMAAEIKKNIKDLNDLIQELVQRDEQKTLFLANLSHELRTPLTASLGYIDYLQKQKLGALNKDQLHSIEIVKRNLEKLNDEIHSLLQVSKYILEGIKLNPQKFSLEKTINSTLNNFKPHIEQKELVINQELKTKEVIADKDQLVTVFENLISNAIKFAEPGTEIQITAHNYAANSNNYFFFSITNQGIEIPEDKIENIFEPFYQIDSGTSRKYGGAGLGLSIVKNIIKAHNGSIKVQSGNRLVTFEFIIPQGGYNG